jgi:hypothetical protein
VAPHNQVPSHSPRQVAADRESEPNASASAVAARWAKLNKRLEYALMLIDRNSTSGVTDVDVHHRLIGVGAE